MLPLESISACAEFFNTEYAAARALFCQLAAELGRAEALPYLNQVGVDQVPVENEATLFTDLVWCGPTNAERVLVLLSGTHGIEGYCGSAIQSFVLAALQQQDLTLPDNTAVLLVHALNPWGMFWGRRCDEQGIDLNRNFIEFENLPAIHPQYAAIESSLRLPNRSARQAALQAFNAQWGQVLFDECFSGGQYHLPWAPFYGGQAPARASQTIDNIIDIYQLAGRELFVIDLHTGLGPYGYGEVISDHPNGSVANDYVRGVLGDSVALTAEGQSFSVAKAGLLDYRWHPLMQERGCFITLEFGTLGTESLFNVILDDHCLWRDIELQNFVPQMADKCVLATQRQAMLKHFCPADGLWQQAVLFRSWQVVQQVFTVWSGVRA